MLVATLYMQSFPLIQVTRKVDCTGTSTISFFLRQSFETQISRFPFTDIFVLTVCIVSKPDEKLFRSRPFKRNLYLSFLSLWLITSSRSLFGSSTLLKTEVIPEMCFINNFKLLKMCLEKI